MRAADLKAEWASAQRELSKSDALSLLAAGFPKGAIMHMIGVARVSIANSRYEPNSDGHWAYVSPIRIEDTRTPYAGIWGYQFAVLEGELVDLVCWDLPNPDVWALRTGDAEWAGCVVGNEPTIIRRNPLSWLYARCSGLLPLSKDRARRWEVLRQCNDIVAEDEAHSDELRQWLVYPYAAKPVFVSYGG